MASNLNPYLHFVNEARAAMEFYQTIFGGTLELHTYEEFHASNDATEKDKIMHSALIAENAITFFAADAPSGMPLNPGATISLSLSGDNDVELSGYYEKLSAGGTVVMPLGPAPWGAKFGMLTDKFGIEWMVNITPA